MGCPLWLGRPRLLLRHYLHPRRPCSLVCPGTIHPSIHKAVSSVHDGNAARCWQGSAASRPSSTTFARWSRPVFNATRALPARPRCVTQGVFIGTWRDRHCDERANEMTGSRWGVEPVSRPVLSPSASLGPGNRMRFVCPPGPHESQSRSPAPRHHPFAHAPLLCPYRPRMPWVPWGRDGPSRHGHAHLRAWSLGFRSRMA